MVRKKSTVEEKRKPAQEVSENNFHKISLSKNFTPILVVLLIIASFLLGALYTKISYLEKSGSTATVPNQ